MAPAAASAATVEAIATSAASFGNVHPITIPDQKYIPEDGRVFPHVLAPESPHTFADASQAVQWASTHRHQLATRLAHEGAIWFRDFPLKSPKDFSDFVEALGVKSLPYVGGAAPRFTVYKDVHTTNESPPEALIPFHHEMAQVPLYPQTVFFFCELAPTKGGETPILPSDIIYQRVAKAHPEFVQKLEEHGVIYTRIIPKEDDPDSPIGRGWVNTFGTTDRDEAEKVAAGLNVRLEWLPNGDVKTISEVLPAIKRPEHAPIDTKKVWFNSVIAAYVGWQDSRNDRRRAVTFGNGDLLDERVVDDTLALMHTSSVAVPWRVGDVVWIDNNQVMHARRSFSPPRRILAYLGKNVPYADTNQN